MGTRTQLFDDLTGDTLDDNMEPTTFSWNGITYELDLSVESQQAIVERLEDVFSVARIIGDKPKKMYAKPVKEKPKIVMHKPGDVFVPNAGGLTGQQVRLDKNNKLADKNNYVSLAKEILINKEYSKPLMCVWCTKQLIAKAKDSVASTFVVSYFDKNKLNNNIENIGASHAACHRAYLRTTDPKKVMYYQSIIALYQGSL